MAYFAKLNNSNVVTAVHAVDNSITTAGGSEDPQKGIDFLKTLYNDSNTWIQTSYNGTIRKNYAGPGFTYDYSRDAFIPPKQFDSWTLNESTCLWEAPVPYPDDGKFYLWNEDNKEWVES